MDNSYFIAILGSAGIGAFVSGVITSIDKWRERTSRREELLLGKAAEMTRVHVDLIVKTGTGKAEPPILMLEDYYRSLKHLAKHDTLDPTDKQRVETELKRHNLKV